MDCSHSISVPHICIWDPSLPSTLFGKLMLMSHYGGLGGGGELAVFSLSLIRRIVSNVSKKLYTNVEICYTRQVKIPSYKNVY